MSRVEGCRATPRHSAGPGHLDMERRLGGGRSLGRRGWRPDHPTIRRGEEDPDSGRLGVQQHPRRAGGDACHTRGSVQQLGDDLDETPLILCTDSQAAPPHWRPALGPRSLRWAPRSGACSPRPQEEDTRSTCTGSRPIMGYTATNGRTRWPRRPPASHRTESLWTSAASPRHSLQGLAGAVAGQPIPVDHGRPVPGAGSHPRTGGRRQRAPAASGALESRKQLPAQDRPPPDPRLPAVRRPRVPGGALPRVSRGAGHAGARDAEMPLPGGHTAPRLRDHTPRDEAAAKRRGRGGLGPRLP